MMAASTSHLAVTYAPKAFVLPPLNRSEVPTGESGEMIFAVNRYKRDCFLPKQQRQSCMLTRRPDRREPG